MTGSSRLFRSPWSLPAWAGVLLLCTCSTPDVGLGSKVDITPPKVTITTPAEDGQYLRGALKLEGKASDDIGVKTLTVAYTGTTGATKRATARVSKGVWSVIIPSDTPDGIAEGKQTIEVAVADASGKASADTVLVYVDNRSPTVMVTYPLSHGASALRPQGTATLDLKGEVDDDSPVTRVEVMVTDADGNPLATKSAVSNPNPKTAEGTNTWSARFYLKDDAKGLAVTDQQEYYYRVSATDAAGNTNSWYYHINDIPAILPDLDPLTSERETGPLPTILELGQLDRGQPGTVSHPTGIGYEALAARRLLLSAPAAQGGNFLYVAVSAPAIRFSNLDQAKSQNQNLLGVGGVVTGTIAPPLNSGTIDSSNLSVKLFKGTQLPGTLLATYSEANTGNLQLVNLGDSVGFTIPLKNGATDLPPGPYFLTISAKAQTSSSQSETVAFFLDSGAPTLTASLPPLYLKDKIELKGEASSTLDLARIELYETKDGGTPVALEPVVLSGTSATWTTGVVLPSGSDGTYDYEIRLVAVSGKKTSLYRNFTYDVVVPSLDLGISAVVGANTINGTVTTSGYATDQNGLAGVRWAMRPKAQGEPTWTDADSTAFTAPPYQTTLDTTTLTDEETYQLWYRAEDKAGNRTSQVKELKVSQASDKPVFEISNLSASIHGTSVDAVKANLLQNGARILGAVADDDGIKASTLEATVDAGPWTTVANKGVDGLTVSWQLDVSALSDGVHTVAIRVEDKFGTKTEVAPLSFVIDTSPPTLTVSGNGGNYRDSLTLTGTAADLNGLHPTNPVVLTLDDAGKTTLTMIPQASGAWTTGPVLLPLSGFADGAHTWSLTVTDGVGKTTTEAVTFQIDRTAPEVLTLTDPGEGLLGVNSLTSRTTVFRGTVSDAGAGAARVWYLIDASTDAPALTTTPEAAGYTAVSTGNGNWSFTDSNRAEGSYVVHLLAEDTAGNRSSAALSRAFDIDTAEPSLEENAVGSTGVSDRKTAFSLEGSADDGYGIASLTIGQKKDTGVEVNLVTWGAAEAVSWTLADLPRDPETPENSLIEDGLYEYTLTAVDKAGKTKTITRTIRLDSTAPTVAVTAPTLGQTGVNAGTGAALLIQGSVTDAGIGTAAVYYLLDHQADAPVGTGDYHELVVGNGNWSVSVDLDQDGSGDDPGLAEGIWYLHVKAKDAADNLTSDSAAVTLLFHHDQAKPTLSVDALGTSTATGFSLSGTAADSHGLSAVSIHQKKDTGTSVSLTVNALTSGGTWSLANLPRKPTEPSVGALVDGVYEYTIVVTDLSGKTETLTRTIKFDATAPTLVITEPTVDSWSSKSALNVKGVASDGTGVGLQQVEYVLDKPTPVDADWQATSGSSDWTVALTELASGPHTVSIRARDQIGNVSTVTSRQFWVDLESPIVTEEVVGSAIDYRNAQFSLSGNLSDDVDLKSFLVRQKKDAGAFVTIVGGGLSVGALGGPEDKSAAWSIGDLPRDPSSIGTASLAAGVFQYEITVTDGNNRTTTLSRTITVDTVPPNLEITSIHPLLGGNKVNGKITLSASANDAYGLDGVKYWVRSGAWAPVATDWTNEAGGTALASPYTTILNTTAAPFSDNSAFFLWLGAKDKAGNVTWQSQSLAVDQSSDRPLGSIDSPTASGQLGTDRLLRGTFSDDDGIAASGAELYVRKTGESWGTPIALGQASTAGQLVSWSVNISSKLGADGPYEAYLRLADDGTKKQELSAAVTFWPSADGGATPSPLTFYFDQTAPSVGSVSVSPEKDSYRAGEIITFSWSASDTSGLTPPSVDVNGVSTGLGTVTNPSGNLFQVSYTVASPGGSKAFNLVVSDTTGRTTSKTVGFVVDVEVPTVENAFTLTPGFVGFTPNGTFSFRGAAGDNRGLARVETRLSGPNQTDASWTTATLSNGTWTRTVANSSAYVATSGDLVCEVRAIDLAGNESTTLSFTQAVDQSADQATVVVLSPVAGTTYGTAIQLSGTAQDDDGLAAVAPVEIQYWNTTPDSPTITVNPTMSGSGRSANWMTSLASMAAGNYAMKARAKDENDHWGPWTTELNFTVNAGVPTLVVSTVVDSYRATPSLTLTGTVSDDDGVAKVEVRVNAGSWQLATGTEAWGASNTDDSWSITVDLGLDGLKTVEIRAEDAESLTVNHLISLTLDTTAPTGSFDTLFRDHPSGSFLPLTALNKVTRITGTVSELNLRDTDPVELSIDGGAWVAVTGTLSWSRVWDTTLLPNGNHSLALRMTDKAGNVGTVGPLLVTTNQTSDNPTVSLSNLVAAPDSASAVYNILSGSPKVSGVIGDDDGFQNGAVILYLDGSAVGITATNTAGTAGTWEYTWPSLAQGEHSLQAVATDRNGQTTTLGLQYFIVDTANPVLALSSPTTGARIKAGTLVLAGTASDLGGLKELQPLTVTLQHTNSASPLHNQVLSPTITEGAWSQNLTIDAVSLDGTLTATIVLEDRAGKQTQLSRAVTIDTTAPTVNLSYPAAEAYLNGLVDISGNADDLNGLADVTLQILDPGNLNLPKVTLTRTGATLSSWSFSFPSLTYASSTYALDVGAGKLWKIWFRLAATDSSGNLTESYPFFFIDTDGDKPTISVSQPKNGETIGGLATMFGAASDDDGPVLQAEVQIDFDGDGDFTDSRDLDLDGSTTLGSSQDFLGTSVKVGDPSHRWEDESAWYVVPVTNGTWSQELNTNGELYPARTGGAGQVMIRVRSRDRNGLASEYTQRTITLDATFPRLDNVSPDDQSYVSGTFTLTASLGDNQNLNLDDDAFSDGVPGGTSLIRVNVNKAGFQYAEMGNLADRLGSPQFGYDLTQPINTSAPALFPNSSGILYVDLSVKDESGLISQRSLTYYVDNQLPTSGWSNDPGRSEAIVKDRILRNTDATVLVSGTPTPLTWIEGWQSDTGTVSGLDRVELYFTREGETSLRRITGGAGSWNPGTTESASTETWNGSTWVASNQTQAFASFSGAHSDYFIVLDQKTEVDVAALPLSRGLVYDADAFLEYGQILDGKYRFGAFFDSSNLPDGTLDVHAVVYDKAGNRTHKVLRTMLTNNGPQLSKLTLGADFNGNGNADDAGEKAAFTSFPGGTASSSIVLRNRYLSVGVEATQGNGDVTAQLLYKGAEIPGAVTTLTAFGTRTGTIVVNSADAFWSAWSASDDVNLNAATLKVVLSDSTAGAALTDERTLLIGIDNIDTGAPSVHLNQIAGADVARSGSTALGHVEPWNQSPFDNQDAGFNKGAEVWGNDADVSGSILFSGTAQDDQQLTGLRVWIDLDGDGTVDGGEQQTVTQPNATTKLLENNPANTLGTWTPLTQGFSQAGHTVSWTFQWNSASVLGQARANIAVEASTTDQSANSSAANPVTAVDGSSVAGTRNRLKVDVVPYIASVVTKVNSLVGKDFNRSATGQYPVVVNRTTASHTFETVTVNGFNLSPTNLAGGASSDLRLSVDPDGLDAGMTTKQGLGLMGAIVGSTYSSVTAQMGTAALTAVSGSGYLTVLTNGIPSLNNVNASLPSNTETTTVHSTLGDDRWFQVWDLNTLRTNAAAPKAANAIWPAMAMNGNTPVFAYVNNALGNGFAHYWNGTTSDEVYEAWDLFAHTALDLNADGNRAALFNINMVLTGGLDSPGDQGGLMANFFYTPPNTVYNTSSQYYRPYNVFLDNLNKPGNTAVLGRYLFPDIAVIGNNALTRAFSVTYDTLEDKVMFRTFQVGTDSGAVGSNNNLRGTMANDLYTDLPQYNEVGLFPTYSNIAAANRRFFNAVPSVAAASAVNSGRIYQILRPGDTDFTTLGATANTAGALFKPTTIGSAATTGTALLVNSSNGTASTAMVANRLYRIEVPGDTDFTTLGAASNSAGTFFVATGPAPAGKTGMVMQLNYITATAKVAASALAVGTVYMVLWPGDTDFTTAGAPSNNPGTLFRATATTTGSGHAMRMSAASPTPSSATAMTSGRVYLIVSVGDTPFDSLGAPADFGVGTVFVANGTNTGTGTGTVIQLVQYTTNAVTVQDEALNTPRLYRITSVGTTDFTTMGAVSNTVGTFFRPTAPGFGTGTATLLTNANEIPVTSMIANTYYYLARNGTTDFTTLGSPSNATGTMFVSPASVAPSGTGTVLRLDLNALSGASPPGSQTLGLGAGVFTAVDATSTGVAVVAYYKTATSELVYRYNPTPTNPGTWSAEVVLDTNVGGDYVDIAVDNTGGTPTNTVHLIYHDSLMGDLKYVRLPSYAAAPLGPYRVDSYLTVGNKASLTLGPTGTPYIAYQGVGNTAKVAWLAGALGEGTNEDEKFTGVWESVVVPNKIVDSESNRFGMGVGTDGRPVIGYSNADSTARGLEYMTKLADLGS